MKIRNSKIATLILLFVAGNVFGKPVVFKNAGLKNEIIVKLDVTGQRATGTFSSHSYDEEALPPTPFTGKVIATPKGKSGVYLEIRFAGTPPYNTPPDARTLVWHLKIVRHRTHLFIPMQERNYEGKTPRWVVDDVEFEPQTDDAPIR